MPISKPLVDLTEKNPGLKKSITDSAAKLAAQISTGIDTTGYNQTQLRIVDEAQQVLLEKALKGTLTTQEREKIIKTACYESYWASGDDYFSGHWWQDKSKREEAYQMLLLEAQAEGSLNLIAIDQEKTSGEINNKILGFQAVANAERTGVWDEGTLSAIENGLVASGIDGSYNITPDELKILSGREIIGRETGYWIESSGLVDSLNNASILMILYGSSVGDDYSNGKAGQGAGDASESTRSRSWGNQDTLQDHFDRHGTDFGSTNPQEYAASANDFYNNRGNYQIKVDSNGVTRVYDPSNNIFGSYNADGSTRTYFKPTDGQIYFDRQTGK